jgi:predicted Zn-dependent peptidase
VAGFFWLVLGAWWAVAPAGAAEWNTELVVPFELHRTELDNGLTVWVQPRPGSGSVLASLVFRAGSRYEDEDTSGASHLLEHLVFTGTERWDEADIIRFIRERGGYRNGGTYPERVFYYGQLEPQHLPDLIDWLSEITFRTTLTPERIAKEREVVFEERGGRDPRVIEVARRLWLGDGLQTEVRRALFPGDGLGWPMIGMSASIDALDVSSLSEFHRRFYVPNNAVLLVVGDVEPDEVLGHAELRLGGLARGAPIERPGVPPLSEPLGTKRTLYEAVVSDNCELILASRGIPRTDPDVWAVDVLAEYLVDVLWEELRIRRGLVYEVGSRNWFHTNVGTFQIETQANCRKVDIIVELMDRAVRDVLAGEVDEARLARVRQQYAGQWALRMETHYGRAEWLSRWFNAGPDAMQHANGVAAMQQLTKDDIVRVGRDVLADERRTFWIERPLLTRYQLTNAVLLAGVVLALMLIRMIAQRRRDR